MNVASLMIFAAATPADDLSARPNIIIIESDDHHFQALGCMGDPVHTPNLDALAARGILFRNHVCQGAQCSPSRNALLTGSYPHNTGIYHNQDGPLAAGVWTFPLALRRAGYTTALIGKDHFKPAKGGFSGSPMEIRKQELQTIGFDYTFGMSGKVSVATAQYMPGNDPYQDYLHERGLLEVLQAHYQEHFTSFSGRRGFTPAALTEEDRQDTFIAGHAADWIASYDRQNPFFLWVEFLDPHPPADPPEPYAGMYDWEEMRLPLGDTPHPQLSVEHIRRFRAGYYAMITALDAQVGRILEALKESGQIDHTVIVFAGDQGSMLGDHGLWGKGDYYKGSVNSPLIIAGPPGWFIPGQVIDRPVETLDLAPTILELAGASAADQRKSYGESLLPLLTGKGTYSRTAAFAETAEWKVAVTDRFKYVIHPKGNILFDLQECPDELVNLIGQQPGTEAAMAGVIEAWICNTTPQAGEAGVTYTFAGPDTCKARLEQMNGVAVSEVAYIQGTAASGGGLSAPAYRLADPENRLFALSSRDIADPVAAYDETHSRFVFSLTAAPDVSIDFRAASLSMTLLGMVADTNAYTVSAYIAYNINQTGWVSQGIRQRVRNVEYDRTDTMGSVLYDAQTGAPLSEYGLPPEANVYARTVSWSLAQADAMAPGSTVEFAVFVFDDKNGNARYYAGADNICVDGIQIIKGD
ncbi:MAG: sulfatase-like hydrolase/transferase [Kiritimatiellales bacterium]